MHVHASDASRQRPAIPSPAAVLGAQFSFWAATTEGLECLVAWLKRIPELGEDLLLLQLLELLEYADLTPSPLLADLTEVVRALERYADKDVAETAERVVRLTSP